ncbi:MAG: small basic protein [Planctomycetota bacterium]
MSIHRSLKFSLVASEKRNVYKRYEKMKILKEKGGLTDKKAYKLPKIKVTE